MKTHIKNLVPLARVIAGIAPAAALVGIIRLEARVGDQLSNIWNRALSVAQRTNDSETFLDIFLFPEKLTSFKPKWYASVSEMRPIMRDYL